MAPNHKQDREMSSVEMIQHEMSAHVRFLGRDAGNAKAEIWKASRKTGLNPSLIERLRYAKIVNIAAHVADTIRAAVQAEKARADEFERHERETFTARISAIEARLMAIDPDFYGPEVDRLRNANSRVRRLAD